MRKACTVLSQIYMPVFSFWMSILFGGVGDKNGGKVCHFGSKNKWKFCCYLSWHCLINNIDDPRKLCLKHFKVHTDAVKDTTSITQVSSRNMIK